MAEFMMIASMWESMTAWFTPTVLFCVTNFIIATIFLASNKHHQHLHSHNHNHNHAYNDSNSLTPLARVSSFLDRATSVNASSYTTAESHHQYPLQSKTANYSSTSRLAQSIYLSPDYVTPPELPESEGRSPSQLTPSLFKRVKSVKFSSDFNDNAFPVQSEQISDSPAQLARTPSFFDRLKSFKISSAFKSGPESTQTETVDADPSRIPKHHVIRSTSEKTPEKKSSAEMKKSRSEVRIAPDDDEDVDLRRPATTRESRNDFDEEVDAKADDFISRFKQQLKLQRLESLVRYNEMLNRRR